MLENYLVGYDSTIHDSLCIGGTFPYLDTFEMNLNFFSLRRHYELINCNELEIGLDPKDLSECYIYDDIMATLLNPEYQVNIGGDVYYLKGDLQLYKVPSSQASEIIPLIAAGTQTGDELGFENARKMYKTDNCTPDFTFNTDISNNSISITYTGSNSNPTRISWTFLGQHGQQINNKNFTFNVPGPGKQTVCVTVMDDNGTPDDKSDDCEATVCKEINFEYDCIADFDFTVGQNGNVCFFDKSKVSPGTITAWSWDFGEGINSTSTQRNPCYNYGCNAAFDVTLTITSTSCPGGQKSVTKRVQVDNQSCCNVKAKDGDFVPYNNGNNKIEWKYKFGFTFRGSLGTNQDLLGKMINFKKKKNGKWTRETFSNMRIWFDGDLFKNDQNDCRCAIVRPVSNNVTSEKGKVVIRIDKLQGGFFPGVDKRLWLKEGHPFFVNFYTNQWQMERPDMLHGMRCR